MTTFIDRLRSGPHYKWLVLLTVGVSILTSAFDVAITNIALPELGREFGVDPSVILWVSVIYLLASLGLILTLGSLGDAIGRKQVFLTGFLIFALGLLIAALSTTLPMLLFGRVVQGIGLALFISNSDAIVVAAFPESERGRAIGLENAFVGIGLSTGPPLGGFLLDTLGWQSLFYTRIPFILLFFVMGLLILRNDRGEGRHVRFDFFGAILLFSFMTTFLLALNRGPRLGWSEPLIIGFVTFAVLSFLAFMYVQSRPDMTVLEVRMRGARFLRERLPVLELSLFLSRQFSASNAANALQFITQGAIIILLPFFLLDGRGLTATEAGLILVTLPIVRLVVAPTAGWIADQVSTRVIATAGLVLMTAAYYALSYIGVDTHVAILVTVLLALGTGISIFEPGNNTALVSSVPPNRLGTASAMIATVRQVSQAVGIAVAGTFFAVIQSAEESRLVEAGVGAEAALAQSATTGFQDVITYLTILLVVAIFVSAFRGKNPTRTATPTGESDTGGTRG